MANLNFPSNPSVGDTYTPEGLFVIYTWNGEYWEANSVNSFDSRFVELNGDNMTGDLTLGGDKIELDASDGSAEFAGTVNTFGSLALRDADGTGADNVTSLRTNNDDLVIGMHKDAALYLDNGQGGDSLILRSDGSATFGGNVSTTGLSTPDSPNNLEGTNYGTRIGLTSSGGSSPGLFKTYRNTTGDGDVAVFAGNNGSAVIKGDGSATFAGNVGIGTTSTNSVLECKGTSDNQDIIQISNSSGSSDGALTNQVRVTCNNNSNWANIRTKAYSHMWDVDNTERMRIDSSGRLLVGTSSAFISGDEKKLQMLHDGAGAEIILGRDDQSVTSGNTLGAIKFVGNAGSYQVGAEIEAKADGPQGDDSKPTRLELSTTPDGASEPTERLRLRSNGIAVFTSGQCAIQQSVKGLTADNTFRDVTPWTNSISQVGGGMILVMLHNHTSTQGGNMALFMIHISYDGSIGFSRGIEPTSGITFSARLNNSMLQFKAFDGATGLNTSMSYSLIYSDPRPHTTA